MLALIGSILAQVEENGEEVSEAKDLYPAAGELIIGLLAFAVLFFFTWKWVLPRVRQVLEERRQAIQGEMEQAEATRKKADQELEQYRAQIAAAREEANRIIEEARTSADQVRRDLLAKAEEDAQATLDRAAEEIHAERDRAFQELRDQIGAISVELAERVVGQSLDEAAHRRLIDEFIDEVASSSRSSNGHGQAGV